MSTDQLAKAESAYRAAKRKVEEARRARNDRVRAAVKAGWTYRQISEATGLTKGRISQILKAG